MGRFFGCHAFRSSPALAPSPTSFGRAPTGRYAHEFATAGRARVRGHARTRSRARTQPAFHGSRRSASGGRGGRPPCIPRQGIRPGPGGRSMLGCTKNTHPPGAFFNVCSKTAPAGTAPTTSIPSFRGHTVQRDAGSTFSLTSSASTQKERPKSPSGVRIIQIDAAIKPSSSPPRESATCSDA